MIAVMAGGGLANKDIALVLSLPLRTVEEDLQRAMKILGLTHTHDLSDVVVAAHYNRTSPTSKTQSAHRAEDTPYQRKDALDGHASSPLGVRHTSRSIAPEVASIVPSSSITAKPPGVSVNALVLLDAAEAAREHTYPRFETVCFLRPSNASYLEATDMLRSAQHEVESEHLHGAEYVLGVEVWGDETHGIHEYRGQRVDLVGGKDTIYWYRVTIANHPPTEDPPTKTTSHR
ncbi:hypothetical protein [Arthrobacter sp. B0490]|uniref:hypothetical protein n=1 Tax=Arthrobacter sp. B0490 TaxID=2058891 RepID=UPI001CA5C1C1|nr:hypothetical protein [Arthrobacter sp. B0490]